MLKASHRILEGDLQMFVNNLHYTLSVKALSNASRSLNCFLLVAEVLWDERP